MSRLFSRTFSSFKYRNFRLFTFGQLMSLSGSWVQGIALSWVAYEITNSPTTLGVVTALSFGPVLLFGFWGGYLVDKLPKFKIIIITHILYSVAPLVVAYYGFIGELNITLLYFAALATGLLRIIDSPARQAFRYALIPESETKNAISIFSSTNSFARIMGPMLAGVLLNSVGAAWCFLLNAFSFWVVIAMLLSMRKEEFFIKENKKDFNTDNLLTSLKHVWQNKVVSRALILSTVLSTLFLNTQVMLPIFTKEVFNLGVITFTTMVAIYSAGSILGGLYSAQDIEISKNKIIKLSYFSASIFLVLSLPISYNIFLVCIFVAGFANTQLTTNLNSLIVTNTENKFLGLVTSLWMMAIMGTAALGGPIMGVVTEYFSVQVFTSYAAIIFTFLVYFWYRK